MKQIKDYTKFDYKINNEYVLINTYNKFDSDVIEYYLEDFKAYCEDNGFEIVGEGTDIVGNYFGGKIKFWDWYYDVTNREDEDFWDGFRIAIKNEPYYTRCVVTGINGGWMGNREIVPTLVDDLYKAVMKCLKDCEYYKLTMKDNVLYVEGTHHDGSNAYEIRLIDSDNYDKLNYWDDEEDGDMEEFFKDGNNFNEFYWDFFGLA